MNSFFSELGVGVTRLTLITCRVVETSDSTENTAISTSLKMFYTVPLHFPPGFG
jgi:hypothetical protein